MQYFLITILSFALIVIGYFIYKIYKQKDDYRQADIVNSILKIGFFIVVCNIANLCLSSEFLSMILYCAYFVSADWLLYYLLYFSIEFIGTKFETHVNNKLLILLLIIDSASLMCNVFFEHLFSLQPTIWFGHEGYYCLNVQPMFYVHYSFVMLLVIWCLLSLFYRAFHAPLYYRSKYWLIAVLLVGLSILNLFTYRSVVDLSIFGYVLEAICIYYCVFQFTPKKLLPKTILQISQDMATALLVLDADGQIIYQNKKAEEWFHPSNNLTDSHGLLVTKWCSKVFLEHCKDFTKEHKFYQNDEARIFKIQLQKIYDYSDQLQGAYFVFQDCTKELEQLNQERYLAAHDSLTGLYNKEYFIEKAEQYISYYPNKELLIICTDIHEFKMINDFFGTSTGDQLLISFASMLKEHLKDAVLYGRLANDVFGILIAKDKYNEIEFANNAQKAFDTCIDKQHSFPTINYIGVYEIKDRSIPVSVMCDRARMAINSIKGDYHKRVAHYNSKMRDTIMYEQQLIQELDQALSSGQIQMYLQPQMSTEGQMLGAEALVRWQHPERGMIMPGDFIPLFERNGLISEIDCHIWELACQQLKKWKEEGNDHLYISVNISSRDFYFMDIFKILTDLISKYEISPQNLKLEITETAVALDFDRQLELIDRLRDYGFTVEMDDFGSGYSSLNMLKDIHVDILKIDMVFLKKSKDEERSKKILQMIINLSKQLGMPVISEGVETREQVQYLSQIGCDMFQGYYFAKPMDVLSFENTYLNKMCS